MNELTDIIAMTPPYVERLPDVLKRVGLSRSTLYELIHRGEFARPIKLGPRAVGWLSTDVTAFLLKRPRTTAGATE